MSDRQKYERYTFREYISRQFDLPPEVISGASVISMVGMMDLTIENYKGIITYHENEIRIRLKEQRMIITGRHLTIRRYSYDAMTVNGLIQSIVFETDAGELK